MLKKHIQDNDVNKLHKQSNAPANRKNPAASNGYALSTEQLHQLLSGDQLNTCQSQFDKAVHKQHQLLIICNTLDRQNSLHMEVELLLTSANGIHWLDQQISEFKSLCPAEILLQLSHPSKNMTHRITNCHVINQCYFSLLNEHLLSPLTTLSRIEPKEMSDHDRDEWYGWCKTIDNELSSIKQQMKSAQSFFSLKTFDKIMKLAKDNNIRQLTGNMKHLFHSTNILKQSVEYND